MHTALSRLAALVAYLHNRSEADPEAGITIVEWMVMGIVAVAAMVLLRQGMIDLGGRIITFIGNELGI